MMEGDSYVPTSQAIKHFLFYDMAMMKDKMGRIPMIAKRLDIVPAEECLSFMVQVTARLDKIIFQDKAAQITNITIGGEGDYRMDVTQEPDY